MKPPVLPLFVVGCAALDNGLARTPQMGYNSWYDVMGTIDELVIRETADAMVSTGLYAAGYNYINLDDCWAERNATTGKIMADPTKWTDGSLKAIADYVHSKGLLFGTYTDRGTKTCAGRPAAQDHEVDDAKTYAEWGVDYLKEDSCNAPGDHDTAFKQYGKMRDALNATGRPVLFSLCGWNTWYAPVGQSLGNSWRIGQSPDSTPRFALAGSHLTFTSAGPDDTNWAGVLKNIDRHVTRTRLFLLSFSPSLPHSLHLRCFSAALLPTVLLFLQDLNAPLGKYAGPGGWNDPCLLLSDTWQMKVRAACSKLVVEEHRLFTPSVHVADEGDGEAEPHAVRDVSGDGLEPLHMMTVCLICASWDATHAGGR